MIVTEGVRLHIAKNESSTSFNILTLQLSTQYAGNIHKSFGTEGQLT